MVKDNENSLGRGSGEVLFLIESGYYRLDGVWKDFSKLYVLNFGYIFERLKQNDLYQGRMNRFL